MAKVRLWVSIPTGEPERGGYRPQKFRDVETLAEGFDIIAQTGEGDLNIEVEDILNDPAFHNLHGFSISLKRAEDEAGCPEWDAQCDF